MSDLYTQYLMQREIEAWWNMLSSMFTFLHESMNSLETPLPQAAAPTKVVSNSLQEFCLDDFPFFLRMFEETFDRVPVNDGNQALRHKTQQVADSKEYLRVFELCKSLHQLEEGYMNQFETKRENIFETLAQKVRNTDVQPSSSVETAKDEQEFSSL